MSFEKLSFEGFVDEIKEVSEGTHSRKFCFVLGAGASRDSGIPSGQELVKAWDGELKKRNQEDYEQWVAEKKITPENMASHYSDYYDKRYGRCPSDGYHFIEKTMEKAKPSAGYVMLAHILTHTPHNVVVTTNFDHLTEDAVTYYAQEIPMVIGHESLAHYISAQPGRPMIIKIHRDLLLAPKSKDKELEVLHENWVAPLSELFSNYHPVFIGYAGNDKSVMDFLNANSAKFAKDEWKFPYWLLYKTDKLEGKVKEFLENSKGYCVYHEGFDEVMLLLAAALDYQVPTKEDFLKDANQRYQSLSNAISKRMAKNEKSDKSAIEPDKIVTDVHKSADPAAEPASQEESVHRNQAIEKIVAKSDSLRLYQEAQELEAEEKYIEASAIWDILILQEPENAQYRYEYAWILHMMGRDLESLKQYNEAIRIDPEFDLAYFNMGLVSFYTKRYQEAVDAFAKSVELAPNSEISRQKYEEALAKLEESKQNT